MDDKLIMGGKVRTEEFEHYVLLNGEGSFVPQHNRPITGKTPLGCFVMFVNMEALRLLVSHKAYMLADGRLKMRV